MFVNVNLEEFYCPTSIKNFRRHTQFLLAYLTLFPVGSGKYYLVVQICQFIALNFNVIYPKTLMFYLLVFQIREQKNKA